MNINTLVFNEIQILPELFMGISIVYLVLHSTFLSMHKNYTLIQNSVLYLSVLILGFSICLIFNENLSILNISILNNTIINDYVSFSSKFITGLLSLFYLLMIQPYLISQKFNHFEYLLLILFSSLGLFLLCSANDLLTAYLAIELQSLSFYVLAAFQKKSTFSVDAGVKYFILGALSSSLFLFGSSFLYGYTGTINFNDFNHLFSVLLCNEGEELQSPINFGLSLIFISLFFKLTIAPFHTWAADVYENSPTISTFFFSVAPKIAIFVLLFRIFYTSFFNYYDQWNTIVAMLVVFSIIVGSFGGLEQRKLKSLLVYSSISHMGYSLLAFNSGNFESIQMLFGYLIIYSFSGLCIWSIFLLTRLKNNHLQKQNKDLTDIVSLHKSNYMLAIFFVTVLFSVAGFPPMIGFLVKISVFLTAIKSSMFIVALVSILCSVVGTFYYLRLIKIVYFEKKLVGKLYYPIEIQSSIIVTLSFFLLLFLFINPTILYLFSHKYCLLSSVSV